ncbi:MAG: hypothetical protein PGN07_04710 [Aeromicrobium erythreum]
MQRDADGEILLVTSDRTLIALEPDDTVCQTDVWIEDAPELVSLPSLDDLG